MNVQHGPDLERRMNARFIRWQGLAIAQFTIAIALISALSISMLAGSSFLALHRDFSSPGAHGLALGLSMLLLAAAVPLCALATVSRTLDFRLTARKARGRHDLRIFGRSKEQFGKISWGFFWTALSLFLVGGLLFVASAAFLLAPRLLCGV